MGQQLRIAERSKEVAPAGESAPRCCGKILVVDDMPENAEFLRKFLAPLGYEVEAAYRGDQALAAIHTAPPDVVLLDIAMPGMSGLEVCHTLKQDPATRHLPVIIITGLSDRNANIEAVEVGADDFLLKPFDRILLEARIRASIRTKFLQDEIRRNQRELEERVMERTRQVQLTKRLVAFSLAKLAESRDNETGDHLERMRCYVRVLAEELSSWPAYRDTIDVAFINQIYDSCPLHDIGKVGIPDVILLKPAKLTPQEFEVMKLHTTIGGDTLKAADEQAGNDSFLQMGHDIAYFHHERVDGSGYPFGLAGDEIPLAARIAALADVYDALSSKRPYKDPFTHETSKEIIVADSQGHFDPDVLKAFLHCEKQFINIRSHFEGTGQLPPLQRLAHAAQTGTGSLLLPKRRQLRPETAH